MTKFQGMEWKADHKESAIKEIFYMDLKTETELFMHQMAAFTEASFWIILLKGKEHLSEVMGVSTSAFGKRTRSMVEENTRGLILVSTKGITARINDMVTVDSKKVLIGSRASGIEG